ncbi:hypothetical protein [Aquimarina aggregata]|uniref:hypothetical protein n=1 Tax=Aquimarina aggregata TaxID=1642818 RepID=UPI0024904845|nr:hypothetical protein [Aquimarina aggregata]
MKLDQFNTENLTQEELLLINGGESGWYYLGKAVGAIEDAYDATVEAISDVYDWATS